MTRHEHLWATYGWSVVGLPMTVCELCGRIRVHLGRIAFPAGRKRRG